MARVRAFKEPAVQPPAAPQPTSGITQPWPFDATGAPAVATPPVDVTPEEVTGQPSDTAPADPPAASPAKRREAKKPSGVAAMVMADFSAAAARLSQAEPRQLAGAIDEVLGRIDILKTIHGIE